MLATATRLVRLGVGQMQCPSRRARVCTRAPHRLPLPFQRLPYRPPVLRRRFHHHFFDVAFNQPRGKRPQLVRRRPHDASLEDVIGVHRHIRHDDRQHPLMHIDACNSVPHRPLLAERRTCLGCLTQGHGLSSDDAHLFAQARTFRIIQFFGVKSSTGSSISPLAPCVFSRTPPPIFMRFRELIQRVGTRCFSSSVQFCTTVILGTEPSGSAVRRAAMNRSPSASTT